MKIIFFNINDARISLSGITQFIEEQRDTTSIFCIQEAFNNSKELITQLLPEYKEASIYKYVAGPFYYRPVTLIKPDLEFEKIESVMNDENTLGPGLYTKIKTSGKILHLINFHGMSRPGNKLDSPERLEQSINIVNYLKNTNGIKVIGGDFNLFPNTQAINLIEKSDYKNLIKEYAVKSTRNEVAWRKYPDTKQYFSDYVFTSPDTVVNTFEVPYNEYSDHLPMIVDIDF